MSDEKLNQYRFSYFQEINDTYAQETLDFFQEIVKDSPYNPISPSSEMSEDDFPASLNKLSHIDGNSSDRIKLTKPISSVYPTLFKRAIRLSGRSFLHAYGARVSLMVLLHLFSSLSARNRVKTSFFRKLSTFNRYFIKVLILDSDAWRFGAFAATFTFIWKTSFPLLQLINDPSLEEDRLKFDKKNLLEKIQKFLKLENRSQTNAFIAGLLASAAFLIDKPERRLIFTEQLAVRSTQAVFYSLQKNKQVRIPNASALVFIFGTAQVLYAYIMHPKTLPSSFYQFMIKSALVPDVILRQVERNNTGQLIDFASLEDLFSRKYPGKLSTLAKYDQMPPIIGCDILHPGHDSCSQNTRNLFVSVFRQIFAVYIPLNLVPLALLRSKQLMKSPPNALGKSMFGALRSSIFFATLVSSYQLQSCLYRWIFKLPAPFSPSRDFRYIYYLFGIVSGSTIFMEARSRRSELAAYVAPKAVRSLYMVLMKRKWMFRIPGFEVLVMSLATGLIMSFYANDHHAISPFLYRILKHFIGTAKPAEKKQKEKI